jgi:glycine/D-amino acid oxidase-like deaminating enzyme
MPFSHTPRPEILNSLTDVKYIPYWIDDKDRPEPVHTLAENISGDLVVIGAGFTGLWTALLAKESDPGLDVILLEAGEAGAGASGRNGGFVAACLTHSFQNGLKRWPQELATLIEMGHANLDAIEETVKRFKIECDFIRSGELNVATEAYQLEDMRSEKEDALAYGERMELFAQEELRGIVNSPLFLGGILNPANAMVNPAKLVWGLRRICLELGVRLFERTQATGLEEEASGVIVRTQYGKIRAKKVALATNAFPPLLKHLKHYIVPVYDYAIMSEPLSASQRNAIGWLGRVGLSDSANQFHYSQITSDGCILWGGYDAVYHWNNGFGPQFETNQLAFGRLADHFFATFPQLEGLRFTHAWGGAIDTCSRFSAFWGRAFNGKLAYAMGYTGLGVGASRFGAQVMLDLLANTDNERTRLKMVREKPFPFPPEPVRSMAINFTRWSLDQADRKAGRRNLWLKLLDATGLGFNS